MKKDIKSILLYVLIIIIVIIVIIGAINHFNNDGMMQTKGVNIYYKTYTDEDGWSKWSKNGVTSGNKKHEIKNIKIKVKSKDKGEVVYKVYSDGKWSEDIFDQLTVDRRIYAVKFATTGLLKRKYNIYYRTYNNKDKWFEWTFDGYESGSTEKSITAIEIKIIPSNSMKYDFLKNYSQSSNGRSKGF